MSRFLITCWPFVGHVYPQISIAAALREHGHEVAFYTDARMRAVVEGEGFPLFPFQRVDESRWNRIHALEAAAPAGKQSLSIGMTAFRDWLVGSMPEQVADLEPIISHWRPDVLITDLAMWAPILVLWETTGIPVALSSTMMGCMVPGPDAPPWGPGLPPPRSLGTKLLSKAVALGTDLVASGMRRRVDQVRAQYGLRPLGCSVNAFTARLPLYLIPSLPELDYNRRDLPPAVHYVGACIWNKLTQEQPPAWLDTLPVDQPWVHVTEGTAHYQDPLVLRAAARGLANQPVQVILTTGPQRDPAALDLGPAAANVRVERWVSHADLLPRCAAVVTTGGPATIMAALGAGVPLVVVPTEWDKPDNAQRVVEAGAGLRLAPGRCTPARLRAAVARVLGEPGFRAAARRLAARLAAAPGPPRAATLLADLASSAATASTPSQPATYR